MLVTQSDRSTPRRCLDGQRRRVPTVSSTTSRPSPDCAGARRSASMTVSPFIPQCSRLIHRRTSTTTPLRSSDQPACWEWFTTSERRRCGRRSTVLRRKENGSQYGSVCDRRHRTPSTAKFLSTSTGRQKRTPEAASLSPAASPHSQRGCSRHRFAQVGHVDPFVETSRR